MGFKYDRLPKHLQKAIDRQDERDRTAQQERDKRSALECPAQGPPGMVNLPGPLTVRIIRHCGVRERDYDDDNMSGGCKELRDAIAAALGRRGDSAQDELAFEYEQRRGKAGEAMTEIEIRKGL